jgi:hypothetical protein
MLWSFVLAAANSDPDSDFDSDPDSDPDSDFDDKVER